MEKTSAELWIRQSLQGDAQGNILVEELEYLITSYLLFSMNSTSYQLFDKTFQTNVSENLGSLSTSDVIELTLHTLNQQEIVTEKQLKIIESRVELFHCSIPTNKRFVSLKEAKRLLRSVL